MLVQWVSLVEMWFRQHYWYTYTHTHTHTDTDEHFTPVTLVSMSNDSTDIEIAHSTLLLDFLKKCEDNHVNGYSKITTQLLNIRNVWQICI